MPYQFKITLLNSPVPIWRRFSIQENYSFEDLHIAVQITMGWENSHLYMFSQKGKDGLKIVSSDGEVDEYEHYAHELQIFEVFKRVGQKMFYEYDFGDSWLHEIVFEKRLEEQTLVPVCLEGEGACPPEDIGGVPGYEIMLKAIKNPKHEQHEEYREWLGLEEGEKFNPKKFNKELVNKILVEAFTELE